MPFYLNPEKLDQLCALRGWKHKTTDLARATRHSVSYVSKILNREERCTDLFMLRYIRVAGVDPTRTTEWAGLFFLLLEEGDIDDAKLNYEKIRGRVPYKQYSPSYSLRKIDNPKLEQDQFSS